MCILLYVKLLWCSSILYIYGQLEEEGLGICAFYYMLNLFGVVVFYTYSQMHMYPGPSPPIDQGSMEYHSTK